MDCKEALPLIHEYLDGDLPNHLLDPLHAHLQHCVTCKKHYEDLIRTELFMRSIVFESLSPHATHRIMHKIPANSSSIRKKSWIRRYPGWTVSAISIVLVLFTFALSWNQNQAFMVKSNELDKVIIHGNTVVVPRGQVMEQDIVLEHGDIEVEGEVKGDIIVVDGHIKLASSAYISGHMEEIDSMYKWLAYKIKSLWMQIFFINE